ncbi:MAG TPA: HD domain-containing phosphohydrolase [Planctomycetaceae bacterium]|nr:HD domain-containing phosphohydrolase [Planctomycetaceae bacterium]
MQEWIAQLPRKQSLGLLMGCQCLALAIGLWMAKQLMASSGVGATGIASLSPALTIGILFFWIASLQLFPLVLFALSDGKKQTEIEHDFRHQQSQLNGELVRTRDAVIFGLAKLAESRDTDTGYHLERISAYSTRLAQALRRDPRFRNQISSQFIRDIGVCSALHDIGKVGVEDAILLKPGPLSPSERKRMQEHARIGAECLGQIERRLGQANFLETAREIALLHHEKWDGSGYPQGLSGTSIPLSARIVAIADVYDALSVARCYKDPIPHEKCVEIIRAEAGKHFDPAIVETFLAVKSEFERIRASYAEKEAHPEGEWPPGRQREVSHQLDPVDETGTIMPLLAASTANGAAMPLATTG